MFFKRDFCLLKGSLSEEQFVHDPEVEHGALSAPSRISHDRESGGVYWTENSLAGK